MYHRTHPCATSLLTSPAQLGVHSTAIPGPGGAEQARFLGSVWIWI
ncbi:hypothetical protein OU787_06875 [Kitasatospora sp. YST-16]|nr:hypothetical protein [Kitasatospora sp. YST-16]WAL71246.1 hypothetical protein OU787_06875 [Kitasatospora sp. YST-16]WNW37282.1 hypothetical protein RKE32_06820 [Streptomyces sp. Li-HN-5-13]